MEPVMTIKEFQKEIKLLEDNLCSVIAHCVDQFKDKMGFSPEIVDVRVCKEIHFGTKRSDFVVAGVKVRVPL